MIQIKDPEQVIGKVIKSINFYEDICAIKLEDNTFTIVSVDSYDDAYEAKLSLNNYDFDLVPTLFTSHYLLDLGFISEEQHLEIAKNHENSFNKTKEQEELELYQKLKLKYEPSK